MFVRSRDEACHDYAGRMGQGHVQTCVACGAKNRVPVAATGRPRCAKCHTELPWNVAADDSNLAEALDAPVLVLIDLWAPWCGPCRMVGPIVERLGVKYAGKLKVVTVNVDNAPGASRRFNAHSIPMLVFWHDGEVVRTLIGAHPEPLLDSVIQESLATI